MTIVDFLDFPLSVVYFIIFYKKGVTLIYGIGVLNDARNNPSMFLVKLCSFSLV